MPPEPRPSAEEEGGEELGGVSAHAWRSQGDADAVREQIRPYLDQHRDEMAGRWLDWDGDDATVVVAFTGGVEQHRAVLEPLGARVVLRRHRAQDLDAIAGELFDVVDAVEGAVAMGTWGDPIEGKAFVEAVASAPDEVRTELEARYGSLAELVWLGPDEYVSRTVAFDGYEIDDDDRTLTVGWNGGVPEPEPLLVEESDAQVLVTASEWTPVGAVAAVGIRRTATVTLQAPLAGRRVVDATTGQVSRLTRVADWAEPEPEPEDLVDLWLSEAIECVASGADAAALDLFARAEAQRPESLSDPSIARKRRLAELRMKRSGDG